MEFPAFFLSFVYVPVKKGGKFNYSKSSVTIALSYFLCFRKIIFGKMIFWMIFKFCESKLK